MKAFTHTLKKGYIAYKGYIPPRDVTFVSFVTFFTGISKR